MIAKLLTIYPQDKTKINNIWCMIGSINGIGNITPYAEFNAFCDPDAFKIVAESGIKLIINPIELGLKSRLNKQFVANQLNNSNRQNKISQIVSGMFEPDDKNTICLYDPNTICALLKPEYYNFIPCDISVNNTNLPGKCVLTKNKNGKHLYQVLKKPRELNNFIIEQLKKY